MGNGYGSECHLLRYLGRHRQLLDEKVLACVAGTAVEWLDFPFDPTRSWPDAEWKGLDFIEDGAVQAAWREFWPQTGSPPNWDAVGRIRLRDGPWEWLLVEAKANEEELASSCGAQEHGGLPRIRAALNETKRAVGVPKDRDWLRGHYQLANRLAVLNFLTQQRVAAHLLLVYFCGDRSGRGRTCPATRDAWIPMLARQREHLSLPEDHPLAGRTHELFLDVCPRISS